jgi:secreted trypsin-like serine protease
MLQEVDVPMVSDSSCGQFYPGIPGVGGFENQTMVCAGYTEGTKDSCYGDSGGPLMVPDAAGKLVQVGIVSWGNQCALPTQYGVYSRVADTTLYQWLQANVPGGTLTPAAAPAPAPTSETSTTNGGSSQPSGSSSQPAPAPAPASSTSPSGGSASTAPAPIRRPSSSSTAARRRAATLRRCRAKARKIKNRSKRARALRRCSRAAKRRA